MAESSQVLGGDPPGILLAHETFRPLPGWRRFTNTYGTWLSASSWRIGPSGLDARHQDAVDATLLDEPLPGLLGDRAVVLREQHDVAATPGLGDRAAHDRRVDGVAERGTSRPKVVVVAVLRPRASAFGR